MAGIPGSGRLHLVGTPIGNLEDITLRALRVLKEVDLIAAEDTRQTKKLLSHYRIATPLVSYHEHNERAQAGQLVARLLAGADVALVSDAGMPGVSDPGQTLVAAAVAAGVAVLAVPGPTAAVTALVISGLDPARFAFEGFLPRQKNERRQALARLAMEERTWVLYEAPHRLLKTLVELQVHLGDRPMAAARELTKLYEEVQRGTPAQLLAHFTAHPPRGEFTLVVAGASSGPLVAATPQPGEESITQAVGRLETAGMERMAAMKAVARERGLSKKSVYQALLAERRGAEARDP